MQRVGVNRDQKRFGDHEAFREKKRRAKDATVICTGGFSRVFVLVYIELGCEHGESQARAWGTRAGIVGVGEKKGRAGAYAFMYSAFRTFGRRLRRTISFSAKFMAASSLCGLAATLAVLGLSTLFRPYCGVSVCS